MDYEKSNQPELMCTRSSAGSNKKFVELKDQNGDNKLYPLFPDSSVISGTPDGRNNLLPMYPNLSELKPKLEANKDFEI